MRAGIPGKWQWQLTISMRRGRKKISKAIIKKVDRLTGRYFQSNRERDVQKHIP